MIRFEDVTFAYGLRRPVLRHCSVNIPRGARLNVTGASGTGKTTFLRLLLGLEKPKKGSISGTEGLRFSVVFQEDRLIESRSVLHNVALFSNEETARPWLARLGLGGFADALPRELSGGMRRRAALARALAHPFDVLVLDEPTTGLDRETAALCLGAVNEAVGDKTLILISHDPADAAALNADPVSLFDLQKQE